MWLQQAIDMQLKKYSHAQKRNAQNFYTTNRYSISQNTLDPENK